MVTTNEGIFLRAIVAQPATYLLLAAGVRAAGEGLAHLGRRWTPPANARAANASAAFVTVLLALAVVGIEAVSTVQAYFGDWPSRPEVRTIYNHNLVALSRRLGAEHESVPVGISALYPLYYHDPWIYRYVTGRDEHDVRWFDGRGCIVYPGASDVARYAFSEEAPLHPTLRDEFVRQAALAERVELDASDENPYFELWDWQGGASLATDLEQLGASSRMWISPEIQFTQPELRQTLDAPPRFGDVMALVGYRLVSGEPVRAGATVELVTYWRALRTVEAEDDWVTFVHLLDARSDVMGGVDVLHCPPTGWLPGDVAVQVHTFHIAADAPSGDAYLEIGVYRRGSPVRASTRMPVIVDGQPAGDRVLLEPLRVE
jgi:hypothetical protein